MSWRRGFTKTILVWVGAPAPNSHWREHKINTIKTESWPMGMNSARQYPSSIHTAMQLPTRSRSLLRPAVPSSRRGPYHWAICQNITLVQVQQHPYCVVLKAADDIGKSNKTDFPISGDEALPRRV